MQAILSSPSLLRNALLLDALATAATGFLMVATASLLSPLLGLPADLLFYAGLPLIPYAGFVYLTARGEPLSRKLATAIVIINALWVIDSIAFLASGYVEPTALVYIFVGAQALVVALFAEVQFTGLRRSA
jgi:hypothetical protein